MYAAFYLFFNLDTLCPAGNNTVPGNFLLLTIKTLSYNVPKYIDTKTQWSFLWVWKSWAIQTYSIRMRKVDQIEDLISGRKILNQQNFTENL